jgi:signal peptidase II
MICCECFYNLTYMDYVFIMPTRFFLLKIAMPIIIFTAITDRILKALVFDYLRTIPEKTVAITSFFNLTQVWNKGVSFGLFKADELTGVIMLLSITILILGFLIYILIKAQTHLEMIALSFIIGGACGNLLDRLYYGAVYDFLDFHYNNIHFWTFNPADVYITIGAILLVYDQMMIFLTTKKGK